MIEVILLAIALAMDAFAVAIGLGAKSQNNIIVMCCIWQFMRACILALRRA